MKGERMIINEQTRLSQIENLLSYLITLIQQQQDIQKKAGIVTQKELLSILKISPNTLRSWKK